MLLRRIAVGGMAELFLAEDTSTDARVVIKRILPYLSHEPEFVQRFLDEARIAAQLDHPNIVRVREAGTLQDALFIAMEFVDGVDLRKLLDEELKAGGPMPYGIAAYVAARVAAGLAHAHRARDAEGQPLGLVHRDVSPQNVMVGFDGGVKLVDFGIARAEALVGRSRPGVLEGKVFYLSPEQLSHERLDHRADLFALGALLYELTTGKAPFAKASTEATLYAIRSERPPAPASLRTDYPEELARIVLRCLEKDRTRRYQQAGDVEADLDALVARSFPTDAADVGAYVRRVAGVDEPATPSPWTTPARGTPALRRRRRATLAAVVGAVVVLAAAGAAWLWAGHRGQGGVLSSSTERAVPPSAPPLAPGVEEPAEHPPAPSPAPREPAEPVLHTPAPAPRPGDASP